MLLKHLAIILLCCHKENMLDTSGNQNLFIFPPKKHTWLERRQFSF